MSEIKEIKKKRKEKLLVMHNGDMRNLVVENIH